MEKYEEAQVFRCPSAHGPWLLLVHPCTFGRPGWFDWTLLHPIGSVEIDGSAPSIEDAVAKARDCIETSVR